MALREHLTVTEDIGEEGGIAEATEQLDGAKRSPMPAVGKPKRGEPRQWRSILLALFFLH